MLAFSIAPDFGVASTLAMQGSSRVMMKVMRLSVIPKGRVEEAIELELAKRGPRKGESGLFQFFGKQADDNDLIFEIVDRISMSHAVR